MYIFKYIKLQSSKYIKLQSSYKLNHFNRLADQKGREKKGLVQTFLK